MQINIDGLKINYIDEGEGEEILFLHGWGSSILPFMRLINTLKVNHRVVALDFPGCGESDTMAEAWDIDDYCNFVIKFINAVNLNNPVLVGHSHGGRVIMKLAGSGLLFPTKMVFNSSRYKKI